MTNETLLLIDGSNLAFRMFFALERTNLRNKDGEPTWAIYGTLKALFDAMEMIKPTSIAVAFDLPQPSFRHELYEEYKANRPDQMPDDLKAQWGWIKESFKKFHIPVLEEAGFEADDLIGILTKAAEKEGMKTVILSGDRDLFQLISDDVKVAAPQRGGGLKLYSPQDVIEELGIKPSQVADYKGIAGDSSDNIPGVKGLGPKSAIKLLEDYGDIDNIYKNLENINPTKVQEKLKAQEDSARLSKHLATILTEEIHAGQTEAYLKAAKLNLPDTESLIDFLKVFEFHSILKKLPVLLKSFNNGDLVKVSINIDEESTDGSNKAFEQVDQEIRRLELSAIIIDSEEKLKELSSELKKVNIFAIDLETTGLNTLNCKIVGWAFAFHKADTNDENIYSYYIPVKQPNETKEVENITISQGSLFSQHLVTESSTEDSKNTTATLIKVNSELLSHSLVLEYLKPILENKNQLQIIQNAKFEHKLFKRLGIVTHSNFFDIMLASYVENPSNKHGLKQQSKRILHLRMKEIEELIGTGRKQITLDQVPMNDVADYAAADAFITYRLYLYYQKTLNKKQLELLKNIDFPFVEVLTEIENTGVSIDTKYFSELSIELHQKITVLEESIFKLSGKQFNIASPKQLSETLFIELGIKNDGKKNKSGNFSTDQDTLEKLLVEPDLKPEQKTLIEKILEYRSLTKLTSTYVDNLPQLIAKETQRIHSDFNQVLTTTGRLSSSNPNLQNIPIKTELGRKVRTGFTTANENNFIVSADYSQIELRVLAHLANEQELIRAFQNNEDIHTQTAIKIMDKNPEEITADDRRIGKTLNFALVYMQGTFATAQQLNITNKEAKYFIDKYFEIYSSIKPFMTSILEFAHENSYVENIFGRRRYFQNINSNNKMLQKEEERQAFNTVIQSAAADIMKQAMIKIKANLSQNIEPELLSDTVLNASESFNIPRIILQVHDEILIECQEKNLSSVQNILKDCMENTVELRVPLIANLGFGKNWLEAH
jgi:DNA polymerase-1